MGGSKHYKIVFPHKNIDMNANDQIQTRTRIRDWYRKPNGPESEGTDGGNVGTDVISP
jgi:hypothetical protein